MKFTLKLKESRISKYASKGKGKLKEPDEVRGEKWKKGHNNEGKNAHFKRDVQ